MTFDPAYNEPEQTEVLVCAVDPAHPALADPIVP